MPTAIGIAVSPVFLRSKGGPTAPPSNLTLPVVTGTTMQGQTLTSSTGTWTNAPTSFAYQWKSAGSNVGTNSPYYVLQLSDVGNTITCTVTATNAVGSASATSAAVGPVTAYSAHVPTPLPLLVTSWA